MALVSPPAHNERELTREMLFAVLDYFSTLLPSRFDSRLVRLVVHGGASMLLHPDLDRLASQTPPFIFSPKRSPGSTPLPTASPPQFSPYVPVPREPREPDRPDSPVPGVKRTQTRDIDIISRSLDVEWCQVGIYDAFDRLKECIALTARRFGLGLDWMNADADVALPMALDPATNTTYDPIYADAVKANNVHLHTIYKSSNGILQLVSVTPFWAVALKMVRYTKSDPGDICLILRNGTNLSGTRWTTDLVEKWLVDNCWPMGYASYDQLRWAQFRSRIEHVVEMVNAYDDMHQPSMGDTAEEDRRGRRSRKKSRNTHVDPSRSPQTTIPQPQPPPPPAATQPPTTTPSWQQQQLPQYPFAYNSFIYPPVPNAYPYSYYLPQQQQLEQPYQAMLAQVPPSAPLSLQASEVPIPTTGPSATPSYNPRSLAEWVVTNHSQGVITRRNTDDGFGHPEPGPSRERIAQTRPPVRGPNIADMGIGRVPDSGVSWDRNGDEEKRRRLVVEWLEANSNTRRRNGSDEMPAANAATTSTSTYIQPYVRGFGYDIQDHAYGHPPSLSSQAIPPTPGATAPTVVPPPPIVSPAPGISVRSPTPEPDGLTPTSSTSAAVPSATPHPASSFVSPPPSLPPPPPPQHSSPHPPQLQAQERQEEDTSPPVIPSSSLLTTSNPRRSVQHRARYGPYGRDGPLGYHRDRGSLYGDEDGEDDESDEEGREDEGGMSVNIRHSQQRSDADSGTHRSRLSGTGQSVTMASDAIGATNERTSPFVPPVPSPQHSSARAQPHPYTNFENQSAIRLSPVWTDAQPPVVNADTRTESQEPQRRTWTGRGGIKELAELVSGIQVQPASSSAIPPPPPPPPASTSSLRSQHLQLHPNSWITASQTPAASHTVTRAATPSEEFVPPFYDSQPQPRPGPNSNHANLHDDSDSDSGSDSSNMDHNSLLSSPVQIPAMPAHTTNSLYYPAYLAHPPSVLTGVQQQQQQHAWAISTWRD